MMALLVARAAFWSILALDLTHSALAAQVGGADSTVSLLQSGGLLGGFVLFIGLLLTDRLIIGSTHRAIVAQLVASHEREILTLTTASKERVEQWSAYAQRETNRAEQSQTLLLQALGVTNQTVERATSMVQSVIERRGAA